MNESYGYVYFRGLKIWDLDIEKCKLVYYNSTRKRKSIKWGALFSCTSIEEMRPILKELLNKKEVYLFVEGLKKITKYYSIMDEDEALRLDDKIRRSLRNEGYEEGMEKGLEQGIEKGLKQGKEQGIEQTTIDMIKSMLENNLNYNTIFKVSGKSLDKIKEIEKSMNR